MEQVELRKKLEREFQHLKGKNDVFICKDLSVKCERLFFASLSEKLISPKHPMCAANMDSKLKRHWRNSMRP